MIRVVDPHEGVRACRALSFCGSAGSKFIEAQFYRHPPGASPENTENLKIYIPGETAVFGKKPKTRKL